MKEIVSCVTDSVEEETTTPLSRVDLTYLGWPVAGSYMKTCAYTVPYKRELKIPNKNRTFYIIKK